MRRLGARAESIAAPQQLWPALHLVSCLGEDEVVFFRPLDAPVPIGLPLTLAVRRYALVYRNKEINPRDFGPVASTNKTRNCETGQPFASLIMTFIISFLCLYFLHLFFPKGIVLLSGGASSLLMRRIALVQLRARAVATTFSSKDSEIVASGPMQN